MQEGKGPVLFPSCSVPEILLLKVDATCKRKPMGA